MAIRADLNALEAKVTSAIETAKFQMIVGMGALTAVVVAIAKLVH